MHKTDRQLVLGRKHEVTPEFVGYADDSAQDNEPNAGLPPERVVRVGTHLGIVVKKSEYPLPGRCWGNNRRGAATWIWSKVTRICHRVADFAVTHKTRPPMW